MDRLLTVLIRILIWVSGFSKPMSRLGLGSYEEWVPKSRLKILMVGYNGAGNTGADARVVAAVKQTKELFGPDKVCITVLTLNEKALEGYFDEDVILREISTIYPMDLFRACCENHVAVICEGSTLKSTFANALSMFFCEASGIMERQGKPCIAFGSEVGHMEDFLRKFAAKTCRGTYFIARTRESMDILEELELQGHVGTDTAWMYEDQIDRDEAEAILRSQGWDGKKELLGVAVIDPFCWPVRASVSKWITDGIKHDHRDQYDKWYFYSDSPERQAAYERYIDNIASAVDSFCKEKDCFPVILGMEKMDEEPCCRLQEKITVSSGMFCSTDYKASEMVGVIRKLSMLITSRYHALVLSMVTGCPVISISMDERLDSLMGELDLRDGYLFHVSDDELSSEIQDALERVYQKRDEIAGYIRSKAEENRRTQAEMGRFLKEYILKELERSGGTL